MARHDRANTTSTERGLLHSYWLLSGYGLRVSRALGCLAAAMLATIGLLMGFGLPQHEPKQEATGTVPPAGGTVTFKIDKDHPQNPTKDRLTGERFEKALNVTLDSVVSAPPARSSPPPVPASRWSPASPNPTSSAWPSSPSATASTLTTSTEHSPPRLRRGGLVSAHGPVPQLRTDERPQLMARVRGPDRAEPRSQDRLC
ncbi:hypothetical protein [Streptomyces poriferorum]|uniref:hypothetical protein n=1 Tax=Streptomyces poriferorum TaxID=2798799 RepID=UPI0027DF02E7|nr:hypothetical protein [Streptomyces poriferorum]